MRPGFFVAASDSDSDDTLPSVRLKQQQAVAAAASNRTPGAPCSVGRFVATAPRYFASRCWLAAGRESTAAPAPPQTPTLKPRVVRVADELGELGRARTVLLKFLRFSKCYSAEKFLSQVDPDLLEERAEMLKPVGQVSVAFRLLWVGFVL